MSELLRLRASRVPLAMICPESLVDDGGPMLGGSGEPANLGSAIHDCIKVWIDRGTPHSDEIDVAGERHGVEDFEELSSLTWRTWNVFCLVREHFPHPSTEVDLEYEDAANGITLTGHIDLADIVENRLHILDHKTGRLEVDAAHQIRAYAYLGIQSRPDIDEVYASVARVRDGSVEPFSVWSRSDLEAWYAGLVERVSNRGSQQYNPGEWCRFCPRSLTCPGKEAYLRQAHGVLVNIGGQLDLQGNLQLPADPNARGPALANLLDKVKVIEKICKDARDLIRADVIANGGAMPTGDGVMELAIRQEVHKSIDFFAGESILRDHVPEAYWSEVFSVSKTAAERAVKASVEKGKGAAWMAVLMLLEQHNALGHSTINKLVTRKAVPALENHQPSVSV